MESWQFVVLSLYSTVVFVAIARHFLYAYSMARTPFLEPNNSKFDDPGSPLVSIMVPAKDEQAVIERCLQSLLAQDYPNFEILVVDDRSEDQTAAIVERLAAENSKLRLVQVKELPPGWTGKTHALHLCQQQAKGDWLLFVDADTTHHRSCLSIVLCDAVAHEADLESLLPALDSQSFWERVIQPFAGACLMVLYPLHKVNDPSQIDLGFANGQFILIRREAYDAVGGHEAVRDKFVEDVHLGRNVRRAGLGLRVAMGSDVSSVRMYSSLAGIVRGWSRILYSAVDGRPGKLFVLLAAVTVFSVSSYAVLIGAGLVLLLGRACPFSVTLFCLGVVHQMAQTTLFARIYAVSKSRLAYLAFRLLAVVVMLYILVRTIRMCRTGNVTWRGTNYGSEMKQ